MNNNAEQKGSQVIARAAMLFQALEQQPQGMTLSALARASGLPRSTVHRLATSLETQGLLRLDESGVRLGPALVRLAAAAHTDVVALSAPAIETLGRRTRETVDLCVFRGSHAVSVSQYVSDQELRVVSAVGTAFPIHCTAHGKAMLASLSDARIVELLGRNPDIRTRNSHSSVAAVLDDIAQVRLRGYALDREEHAPGVCGIGVFLNCGLNEHYALSVAVPSLRFDQQFELLLTSVMQCKAEIEALVR